MKTPRISILVSVIVFSVFCGCASLTHHRNEARLAKVRKIAVVGFSVVQPAPASIGFNLNRGQLERMEGGDFIPKRGESINEMYDSLAASFAGNVAWQVVPASLMKRNTAFQHAFERTMKGWQNKMPVGSGRQQFLVDGIMDNEGLRILGKSGRNELLTGLGVDGLVTAQVDVFLNGTAILGVGNRYPQARVSFRLYTQDSDSPDWFEGNLQGEIAKSSVGATAFFDEAMLNKLALESARTAFAQIGKRL